MKSKLEQLREKLRLAKGELGVLTNAALAGGREYTDYEQGRADELLDQIKTLEGEISEAKGQQAMYDQLAALGVGQDYGRPAGSASGIHRRGAWSKVFIDRYNRGFARGQKAVIEPTGSVNVPALSGTVTPLGDRVETILQLVRFNPLNGTDGFSYLRETVRSHQAATVIVGREKPTSTYTVERVDDRVRTIAHISEPVPRQYLADLPLLRQYVDGALREGLELELEWQIVSGAGGNGGEDFTGLLNTSGIQVQAYDTDLVVTARKAITLLELQSIEPTAFVMHPSDWEAFELLTETSGAYLLQNATQVVPVDRARRRLWGYPVARTLGITQGTGLLVDFAGSARAWEREGIRIDWSEASWNPADAYDTDGSTDFQRNQLRFRCEGRWGFAVMRPAGVVEIDLESGS